MDEAAAFVSSLRLRPLGRALEDMVVAMSEMPRSVSEGRRSTSVEKRTRCTLVELLVGEEARVVGLTTNGLDLSDSSSFGAE